MLTMRHLAEYRRSNQGTAAVEFMLAGPILITIVLAGIDTGRYIIACDRLAVAAETVAQMVAVNTSGTLSDTDLQFYRDSVAVIYPQSLADAVRKGVAWTSDIGITISDIAFQKVNKVAVPHVVWSGGSAPRSCTVAPVAAASDTATPTSTTLPPDVFGNANLIVVDINFTFRPTIATAYLPPLPIARSFYVAPRYVTSLTYTGPKGSFATNC